MQNFFDVLWEDIERKGISWEAVKASIWEAYLCGYLDAQQSKPNEYIEKENIKVDRNLMKGEY